MIQSMMSAKKTHSASLYRPSVKSEKSRTGTGECEIAVNVLRGPLEELNRSFQDSLKKKDGKRERRCLSRQFSDWAIKMADLSFQDIGRRPHAVPYFFIGRHQAVRYSAPTELQDPQAPRRGGTQAVSEEDRKIGLAESGQVFVANNCPESEQRGETPHRSLGRALMILSISFERSGDHTLFLISQYKYQHLLSWIRKPKMAEKYFHKDFKEVFRDPSLYIDYTNLETLCKDRGELDLMALHEKKGIILIQVKSVSRTVATQSGTLLKSDKILEKITYADKTQLSKDAEILNKAMEHSDLWGDRGQTGKITLVIAVPNLTRTDLQELNVRDHVRSDIVFLCKEDMMEDSIEEAESEADISSIHQWWDNLPEREVTPDCIKEVVGKYVGPLSAVVEPKKGNPCQLVYKFPQCVKQAALLSHRFLLTSRQIEVLERITQGQKRVYISGPPGAGKTLVLIRKALTSVECSQDHQVIVVNMYRGEAGRAIGQHIFDTIRFTTKTGLVANRVHHLEIDLHKNQFIEKVKHILQKAGEKKMPKSRVEDTEWRSKLSNVLFIVDEVYMKPFWEEILVAFSREFADSEVWCAGLLSENPPGFHEHKLDIVLRCPPAVQNVLYHVDWDQDRKKNYRMDCDWLELSSNGPVPLCVRHGSHMHGNGDRVNGEKAVLNCEWCALELVEVLRTEGFIPARKKQAACVPLQPSKRGAAEACVSSGLESKVVILINMPRDLYEVDGDYIASTVEKYEEYMSLVKSSPFIKILTDQGVVVDFITELASKEVCRNTSDITATWLCNFQGLEAEVVIFVPGDSGPGPQTSSQRREIPAPGLKNKGDHEEDSAARGEETTAAGICAGAESEATNACVCAKPLKKAICTAKSKVTNHPLPAPKSVSPTLSQWTKADISRYSDWDKTSILLAGSRSLSLLILMVP